MISRFAPSPTGFLHLGNLRTALICYLKTKSADGKFLLRIDDTDTARTKKEYVDQIIKDLDWMQIKYDQVFFQSSRFLRYQEVIEKLIKEKKVYPCFQTKEELEKKRNALLKSGLPPVYDRYDLKVQQDSNRSNYKNRKPYYRFKIDYDQVVSWHDKLRGNITIDLKSISDPVVLRENGVYTYMITSAVDDLDHGVNYILRGEDHITNTALQIQILKAIGACSLPEFTHIPLVKTESEKISKRDGGYEIKNFKDLGYEPEAIANYLINLGSNNTIDLKEGNFVGDFDIKNYSASAAKVSLKEIDKCNEKFLQSCSFDQIQERLDFSISQDFWNLIKNNINKISDIEKWKSICSSGFNSKHQNQNKEFFKIAIEFLPKDFEDQNSYLKWIGQIIDTGKYSKKFVNMTVRAALTDSSKGPELGKLAKFLGRFQIENRLKKYTL